MPSDKRVETALRVIAGPIERYRSAVVSTAEEVRGYLASRRSAAESGASGAAAALGKFASDVVDIERFTAVVSAGPADDPLTRGKVEKAFDILRVISTGEDADLFHLDLEPGTRLRDAVARRLSEIGRAFAAARVAGMVTDGRPFGEENGLLAPLAFERWNTAERDLAPALVVELDGKDLHAADLTDFLDGNLKIVLVVRRPMAPAPLVRLITPGTFVLQTGDETGLDRFDAAKGPAVAAMVPEGAARFIHDPAGGDGVHERLEIWHAPTEAPKSPIGGLSARQQQEESRQLRALATAGPASDGAAPETAKPAMSATATESPVDKLAAWLLNRADLDNLE